ncbi:MAG: phosphohistidine phosphatase SixA [Thaumarchaeota archaeon]|nr:phosphohistidine phosphatase SixA [Nitrososphaerota archaeon]
MIVYLLRHGEAEPKSSSKRDEERRLSPEGILQLRKTLNLAKHLDASVDRVISSPVLRAKESSEIVAEMLQAKEMLVSNSLEPESTPSEVYDELSKCSLNDKVALVTHQPLFSNLLQDLLGIEVNVNMKAGSLARIDVQGYPKSSSGTLVYLFSAEPANQT